MTQRGNHSHDIRNPDSISLGELALAAGIARRPVTVCFAESNGIVARELWSYFGQLLGAASVLRIHSRGDTNKLSKNFGYWRLLIVHAPQLLNEIAWKVSIHGRENATRPSIFVRGVPDNVEDLPMPVLALRSNSEETSAIVQWLLAGCPSRAVLLNPPDEIAFDPGLLSVLTPISLPNGLGPESLGDCKLLAALLAGTRLIRGIDSTVPPTHARQQYEQVRRLFNSAILASQAAPISQLAVDMVRRANVFLRLKSDPAFLQENRTFCTSLDHIHREQRNQTSHELISRREIADLRTS